MQGVTSELSLFLPKLQSVCKDISYLVDPLNKVYTLLFTVVLLLFLFVSVFASGLSHSHLIRW